MNKGFPEIDLLEYDGAVHFGIKFLSGDRQQLISIGRSYQEAFWYTCGRKKHSTFSHKEGTEDTFRRYHHLLNKILEEYWVAAKVRDKAANKVEEVPMPTTLSKPRVKRNRAISPPQPVGTTALVATKAPLASGNCNNSNHGLDLAMGESPTNDTADNWEAPACSREKVATLYALCLAPMWPTLCSLLAVSTPVDAAMVIVNAWCSSSAGLNA